MSYFNPLECTQTGVACKIELIDEVKELKSNRIWKMTLSKVYLRSREKDGERKMYSKQNCHVIHAVSL